MRFWEIHQNEIHRPIFAQCGGGGGGRSTLIINRLSWLSRILPNVHLYKLPYIFYIKKIFYSYEKSSIFRQLFHLSLLNEKSVTHFSLFFCRLPTTNMSLGFNLLHIRNGAKIVVRFKRSLWQISSKCHWIHSEII